ncbi:MAG: metallophosphoesterase [bacterium]|nr:metallophosphoesterase [bacterium]
MPPNITAFSIIIGAIITVVEIYVVGHWTSFVRKQHMNHWWYRAAWALSAIMLCIYWYIVYRRHFFRMDGPDIFLFGLVSFWALPKVIVAVGLLIRDVARGVVFIIRKFRAPSKPLTSSQLANNYANTPPIANSTNTEIVAAERRAFLARASWTMAAVPFVIVGKGIWKTLYNFRIYHEEIRLPNLPKSMSGFRIVQISDIHAGSFPDHKPFQEVRRIVESLKPDALFITGDFVNAQPSELRSVASDLAGLAAAIPVYATLGNHDHYHTPAEHEVLVKGIRELGIDLLNNSNRRIGSGSNKIVLAGTDNTGFKQEFADLSKALSGSQPDDAIILLAHDPTFWDKEVVGTDVGLMLAGHTHGGQFGVQLGNYEWSPAKMVYKQSAGLYSKNGQQLYVNRGVGTVGPPMRIGIPPEITVITLVS